MIMEVRHLGKEACTMTTFVRRARWVLLSVTAAWVLAGCPGGGEGGGGY